MSGEETHGAAEPVAAEPAQGLLESVGQDHGAERETEQELRRAGTGREQAMEGSG